MEWDGLDRRRTPCGRRTEDHCAEHHVRWEMHDKDKDSYRSINCGKIAQMWEAIKSKADNRMVMVLVMVCAGLIGTQWVFLNHGFDTLHRRISDNLAVLNKIENSQIEFTKDLKAIEQKLNTHTEETRGNGK